MIRHDYTSCAMCHADPSGAGILTPYGRAQSEVLLRTTWRPPKDDEDPAKLGGFAFGAVTLPEWLGLQVDARSLALRVAPPSPAPATQRLVLMQADAAASLAAGPLRMSLSLGYLHEGGLGASLTRGDGDRLVSRQHWAGVAFGESDAFLLRAGRLNLPFGLRVVEHTSFVRSSTRTDINAAAQHGVALAYNTDAWRAEAMLIAGNLQLAPDSLRERGVAGYVERPFSPTFAAGASTLVTHTARDLDARTEAFRQAHGIFARFVPAKPVVILAEADALLRSPKRRPIDVGLASLLQVDVEPVQGLHVMATGELMSGRLASEAPSYGGWLSAMWFFLPHVDVRADAVLRSVPAGPDRVGITSLLLQLHGWL